MHTVRKDSINIKEKKRVIEQIYAKNRSFILELEIK